MTGGRDTRAARESTVRAYYDALDSHEYEQLETLLTPTFVHIRPEMTLEGRDRFIQFMETERPMTDTTHPVDAIYLSADTAELAARGRLLASEGGVITTFVDVFSFESGKIGQIRTFTN